MKFACINHHFILSIWIISVSILNARFVKRDISWNDDWAFGCDFFGNDFMNVQSEGQHCGEKCRSTHPCTHFTWTNWNGGTCWMKQGNVPRSSAIYTGDKNMVCGSIIDTQTGTSLDSVHTTYHGAHESGACALPQSSYSISNAVALGNIDSLQHLKFRPELCGHVLHVDCGNGGLDIVIMNSNLGGGLDLYGSTWNQLTNHRSPGIAQCSVKLSSRKLFNFDGPRCFYKPGTDFGNAYYVNVGLLNTNGRIVKSASLDSRFGEHRGDNPYFAFNFGPIDVNHQVVFQFEDGSTHQVFLRDCEYVQNEQMWS